MDRIGKVRAFDHIVLLVAAQPVLRAERGGQADIVERGQGIERMREVRGDRCRMRDQRDPLAVQRFAQIRLCQKSIDTEEHGASRAG